MRIRDDYCGVKLVVHGIRDSHGRRRENNNMGICEDVNPGTCDGVFIFFLVEMSILGFVALWFCCISPCVSCCFLVNDERGKTETERNTSIETLRKLDEDRTQMMQDLQRRTNMNSQFVGTAGYMHAQFGPSFHVPHLNEEMRFTPLHQPMNIC
jgi:hypothetical protein